jgi:hypothetical protein
MLREEFLHALLQAVYQQEQLDIYEFAIQAAGGNAEMFASTRLWAHQLVRDKLCTYCDLEKTQMEITNYGRYWMLHDGYFGFLKDEHALKEKEQKEKLLQKETLLEARLKLTQYRLAGFWWALIISIVGLVLSVFNLYLFLSKN